MTDQPPDPPTPPWPPPEPQAGPLDPGLNPYGAPWTSPAQHVVPRGPYAAYVLPPPSKKLAGWALGLSLVPCFLTFVPGGIMAIVVLVRGRDGRDHGVGLAVGALCASGIWTLLTIMGIVGGLLPGDSADRDDDGRLSERQTISTEELRVGDCFLMPDGDRVLHVVALPCDEPHHAETFDVFTLPGSEYPGLEQVDRRAYDGCLLGFFEFVGTPYRDSELNMYFIYPTPESWELGHDEVSCSVYEPAGPRGRDQKFVTGTLRGAER